MTRTTFSLSRAPRRPIIATTVTVAVVGTLLVRALTTSNVSTDSVVAETVAQVAPLDLTAHVTLTGRLDQTDTRSIYWQQPPPAPTSGVSGTSGTPSGSQAGGAARGSSTPATQPARPAGETLGPPPTPSPPPPTSPQPPITQPPPPTEPPPTAPPPTEPPPTAPPPTEPPPTAPPPTEPPPCTTEPPPTEPPPCTTEPPPTTDPPTQPQPTTTSLPTTTSTGQTTSAGTDLGATELVVVSSSTATAPDQSPPEEEGAAGDGDTTAHTITAITAAGQQLAAGDVMFAIDGQPAVLMLGAEAAYRDLDDGVDDGPDVAQLEQNLTTLGFTADGDIVVDEHFDTATTAAVDAWQESLGVEATGTVELGDVVFLPDPVTVVTVSGTVGAAVDPGAHLLDVAADTLVAVADVPVRELGEVTEGSGATVTLADGTSVPGTVLTVGDQATRPADAPIAESTVEITVQLDATDSPAAVDFAAVTVAVTTATRSGVLTVPVAAIVDGGEGRTAVLVPTDDGDGDNGEAHELVVFEPGLSAGGYVEVADDSLAEGATVLLSSG
jgi:peptidoglycan hydrolase-like protein with peptidoglycan-binding domain